MDGNKIIGVGILLVGAAAIGGVLWYYKKKEKDISTSMPTVLSGGDRLVEVPESTNSSGGTTTVIREVTAGKNAIPTKTMAEGMVVDIKNPVINASSVNLSMLRGKLV